MFISFLIAMLLYQAPTCTPNQQVDIALLLADANERFATAVLSVPDLETAQDNVKLAVAYEEAIAFYNQQIYPEFPDCAESIYTRELAAAYYEYRLTSTMLLALLIYETDYGDIEKALALSDAISARTEATEPHRQQLNEIARSLVRVDILEFDLPDCGEETETLSERYVELFLDDEDEDTDLLLTVESIASEHAALEICNPTWFENDRTYRQTVIPILMAELLPYEQEHGDMAALLQEQLTLRLEADMVE